jgi:type I restriction enzyme S subunit
MSNLPELPSGWTWKKFEDVAEIASERGAPQDFPNVPHVAPDNIESGTGKLLPYQTVREDGVTSTKYRFFPGQILYSKIRPYLAKATLVDFEGLCSADMYPIAPKIDRRFLFHWMISPEFTRLASQQQGRTVLPKINMNALRKLPVPVPPLPVQRRIAAKLDALTSHARHANDYLTAIPPLIDQFRQSVLARAFTGELTADWRKKNPDAEPASELLERIKVERREKWIENYARNLADRARKRNEKKGEKFTDEDWQTYFDKKVKVGAKKYEEPEAVDAEKEGLPEVPETWEWVRVEMVGDVQLGRQRSPRYHTGSNMMPYLRVANVYENRFELSDVMEMHFSAADYEQYRLESGDILLNEGQSAELVGRPAIYRNELPGACFTNTLIRFRNYTDVSAEYALLIFRAYMHTGRFTEVARVTTNIAHLGASRFAEMAFPIPPLDEQQQIVRQAEDLLDMIMSFERFTDGANRNLEQLNGSMLSQILSEGTTEEAK